MKVYELPDLGYPYDALEPYIDAETMRLHHTKHHQAYVDKANEAVKAMFLAGRAGSVKGLRAAQRKLAFNLSGHLNHTLFWKVMGPSGGRPSYALRQKISRDFGSMSRFKRLFSATAEQVEGPGWAALSYDPTLDRLLVHQIEGQHVGPRMAYTILLIDVWEHAYYLRYHNRRADYIDAWWNVVDWSYVNELFEIGRSARV